MEIGQLPEFDVVRLLEAAHQQLRTVVTSDQEKQVITDALLIVNNVLEEKHRSSTDNASELSEQLRRAARTLLPLKSEAAQRAMMDMLAAADMAS